MEPLSLAQQIEDRYRRYLETTFYFRDPELRASFQEALRSGHLRKGPYLEATPVFKRGKETKELLRELLTAAPDAGFLRALKGNRRLYFHQEEAIRKVSGDGRNVVVATGTASGKTETFLYPILLHLYQEFRSGQLGSGVRALILYPMNALANDQRERLGDICERLRKGGSQFRFTFGQYIGETPENENDSRRHARDHIANRLPGELVLRSQIRDNPPHILLTNYSMLEYLLIRPYDSPLFDDGRAQWWTFLVLDEAHQYRGTKGIEMGMLLRRLKGRLREGGRTGPFRCIATSATIAGGERDKPDVAKFASELFGEEFLDEDVILGVIEPVPEGGSGNLSPDDYHELRKALDSGVGGQIVKNVDRFGPELPDDMAKATGLILQHDHRSAKLRQLITDEPWQVHELADEVFPDLPGKDRIVGLSELVELLLEAQDPLSGDPLLSARYHLFLRSLEGAFVSYFPQKQLFLERRSHVQRGAAFEVALCRECGQHYLVGRLTDGKLQEAVRDPSHPYFGATFFRPIEAGSYDTEGEEGSRAKTKMFRLCVECGAMVQVTGGENALGCEHANSILVEQQEGTEEKEDQLPRCSACGYRGPDPVREVVHGTDGPHAVIATTLYQRLPRPRRKILAFADGRQQAAFFAWYLDKSYKDILNRSLILSAVQALSVHTREGISLRELAIGLRDVYRKKKVLPPAVGDLQLRWEAWRSIYREFVTDEQRISLDGVGLVRWQVKWPERFRIPDILFCPPWSLSKQDAQDLASVLLDFMRMDRAVELRADPGVSLTWSDLDLQASQMRVRIGRPRRPKGRKYWSVRSWDGKMGKRAQYLIKLLMKKGASKEEATMKAQEALRHIWEALRQSDESTPSQHRFLLAVDDARRLNPDWWRVYPMKGDDVLFQCDTCARLQAVSIGNVCTRYRCPGTVREIRAKQLTPNHYRLLYEEDLPGMLRVEEHTAQIDKEKAREFQRAFRAGEIHVLSCSTTFELGVDLGDLDIIFLRNIPPEAFNYAQRVGRAGRRPGFPGFAVTFCRRAPHDLYHFAAPERMLRGIIRPPTITLRNEKIITRHIAATALSHFFRTSPERFQSVEELLKDLEHPCGITDFNEFLRQHKAELEESLREIAPPEMANQVGLNNGEWIERVVGDDGRFSLAEAEVSSDFRTVKKLQKRSSDDEDYKTADWAKARAKTIAEEDVLSFLSRKAVIPKYGFPVDVVELDAHRTQRSFESMQISLQRDLAIAVAEFAPTSKVVANKKVWTSYGLKKVAEKEWDRKCYVRCYQHNLFVSWKTGEERPSQKTCREELPSQKCCSKAVVGVYLIPKFGFVTDRSKPKEPKGRPARVFTTRPYFVRWKGVEPSDIDFGVIRLAKASPGWMVVLCEGRRGKGFYICGRCGAGFRGRKKHKTPYGEDCSGTLEQVSLGHEFVTDVLRLQFCLEPPRGDMEPVWFAYSLAYALVEGAAEVLEVPSIDLSATVAYSSGEAIPPIVLYDNVPGGAGLVARLEEKEVLGACLEAARKRVSGGCGCDENTSCYGCLRSYRNQFAHQHLRRGPVMHYLETVLAEW